MACKVLLTLFLLVTASPASLALIEVQQMLAGKSQYSGFLKLLTQTKVADDVKWRKSASVLVVTDKAIKPLLSVPADKQRMVMLNHALLKYIDPIQLSKMKARSVVLETLLFSTNPRLGVINYTRADNGQMYLHVPGSTGIAKLVKVVAACPFTASIMEVSAPIMCPELAGTAAASAATAASRPKDGKAGKVRPMSDESGVSSRITSKPASEAAAKPASTAAGGSGWAKPSAAPTTSTETKVGRARPARQDAPVLRHVRMHRDRMVFRPS